MWRWSRAYWDPETSGTALRSCRADAGDLAYLGSVKETEAAAVLLLAEFRQAVREYHSYSSVRPLPAAPSLEELPTWLRLQASPEIPEPYRTLSEHFAMQLNVVPRSLAERFAIEDHLARVRPFVEGGSIGLQTVVGAVKHLAGDAPEVAGFVHQFDVFWDSIRETPLISIGTGDIQNMGSWEQMRHVLYGGVIHGDAEKKRLLRSGRVQMVLGAVLYWLGHVLVTLDFVDAELEQMEEQGLLLLPPLPESDWDFAD